MRPNELRLAAAVRPTAIGEVMLKSVPVTNLIAHIEERRATIGVIGLGYVGMPLSLVAATAGFKVIGFDIDAMRVAQINRGESFINHIPASAVVSALSHRRLEATAAFGRLGEPDAILICVPTPLTRHREPDLTYIEETARAIASRLRPGQLIVLESTTYPGTTEQIVKPILEKSGLKSGSDFFLAYSPEREDPGNPEFNTAKIPKVVGGDGAEALALANALYSQMVPHTVPVSSTATAETVKLTENIFRAVNIALVNELKIIYSAMGIDVWEVIRSAKTKPFGFMPFYPGPGLGGHCIPIDPFYLSWKAREFGLSTRFIELAGEINIQMPEYVIERLIRSLDQKLAKALSVSSILIVGLAYKKNVDDTRESPSLKLFELMESRGAHVDYHDPLVPVIPATREHPELAGRRSVPFDPPTIASYDAVLIATDHDAVDYRMLVANARLVIDTRDACRRAGIVDPKVVRA